MGDYGIGVGCGGGVWCCGGVWGGGGCVGSLVMLMLEYKIPCLLHLL